MSASINHKNPDYLIYNDGVISVGLFAKNQEADRKHLLNLGMRWLAPASGQSNAMGGETDWFLLPHSFGVAVGRTMIEQKIANCGLESYFNEEGFSRMVSWLVEMEALTDAMCY